MDLPLTKKLKHLAIAFVAGVVCASAFMYFIGLRAADRARADISRRDGVISVLSANVATLTGERDELSGRIATQDKEVKALKAKLDKLPPVPPKPDHAYVESAPALAALLRGEGLESAVPLFRDAGSDLGIGVKDGNTVLMWAGEAKRAPVLEQRLGATTELASGLQLQLNTTNEALAVERKIGDTNGKVADERLKQINTLEKNAARAKRLSTFEKVAYAVAAFFVGREAGRRL